jgi:hypothetical protein
VPNGVIAFCHGFLAFRHSAVFVEHDFTDRPIQWTGQLPWDEQLAVTSGVASCVMNARVRLRTPWRAR